MEQLLGQQAPGPEPPTPGEGADFKKSTALFYKGDPKTVIITTGSLWQYYTEICRTHNVTLYHCHMIKPFIPPDELQSATTILVVEESYGALHSQVVDAGYPYAMKISAPDEFYKSAGERSDALKWAHLMREDVEKFL